MKDMNELQRKFMIMANIAIEFEKRGIESKVEMFKGECCITSETDEVIVYHASSYEPEEDLLKEWSDIENRNN